MQIVVNSLLLGATAALLSVALQIVYLPTNVLFVGLAGFYSLTPYLVMTAQKAGWPVWGGSAAAIASVMALTTFCELANHAPLARKHASEGAHLISSLGIYIIVVQVIVLVWGSGAKSLRLTSDTSLQVAGIVLTGSQLLMGGVATLFLVGGCIMLRASDIGLRLRALADNPTQFALLGLDVAAHRVIAFALAGLFAGLSSLLTAYDVGFDPYSGLHAVLLAVVAIIIGGRHLFIGPVVGALVLSSVRAQVVWQFSARWEEAITFVMLALFLLIRPQGLFARQARAGAVAS